MQNKPALTHTRLLVCCRPQEKPVLHERLLPNGFPEWFENYVNAKYGSLL